jgi:hypothetical protein
MNHPKELEMMNGDNQKYSGVTICETNSLGLPLFTHQNMVETLYRHILTFIKVINLDPLVGL